MHNSEHRPCLDRRAFLVGVTGAVAVAALPAVAAYATPIASHATPIENPPSGRHPSNWPELEPYGTADTRVDLWPRADNSFVLPLEHRPRDPEGGHVWMRDTYVNCFVVNGRPVYVATGTTRVPELDRAAPWNDGIFIWVSSSLRGPWRLVDTLGIRPDAEPGKVWSGGPAFVKPGAYHHIDGSMYTEGDHAWLVLHNNEYAKFRDDMEDITPTADLPAFQQSPYSPEPYLEGAYVFKYGEKYYLLHAAWDRSSVAADGSARYAYDPPGPGRTQYQYDAVVAVSDSFEGPYSRRWTAGVGAGHNNFFQDHSGKAWATFFRNPTSGYWSDPSRTEDAAVPGVAQVEWTGPEGNRLYLQRRQGRD